MYKLYYYPQNASMAPHFILEEVQAEFELILVDRNANAQKSQAYLELNPAGRIPVLIDDDQAIFESPAICVHLAEKHPEANLIPEQGSAQRALFFQWIMYLTNTLQAELMLHSYPEEHSSSKACAAGIAAVQEKRLEDIFQLLDDRLENNQYLVGDNLTVCDHFLFMLTLWTDGLKKPPLAYPNISRYLRQLIKRPAVERVCIKENLSLDGYT